MPKVIVDIEEEEIDRIVIEELKSIYNSHYGWGTYYDNKLLKSLKRVIEYYGGNVDG